MFYCERGQIKMVCFLFWRNIMAKYMLECPNCKAHHELIYTEYEELINTRVLMIKCELCH
jgi:hypothetical protein